MPSESRTGAEHVAFDRFLSQRVFPRLCIQSPPPPPSGSIGLSPGFFPLRPECVHFLLFPLFLFSASFFFFYCVCFFSIRGTARLAVFHSYFHGPASVHRSNATCCRIDFEWRAAIHSTRPSRYASLARARTTTNSRRSGLHLYELDFRHERARVAGLVDHFFPVCVFFVVFFPFLSFPTSFFFGILQSNGFATTYSLLLRGFPDRENKNTSGCFCLRSVPVRCHSVDFRSVRINDSDSVSASQLSITRPFNGRVDR